MSSAFDFVPTFEDESDVMDFDTLNVDYDDDILFSGTPDDTSLLTSKDGYEALKPLIFFDWDDTLLPSSWIQLKKLMGSSSSQVSFDFEIETQLQEVTKSVITLLSAALEVGNVIIVTNAETNWVEQSAAMFLPDLVPLLNHIRIVSARSQFERFYVTPMEWKIAAMQLETDSYFGPVPNSSRVIFSFGDSTDERSAVQNLKDSMTTIKTIKLCKQPDISLLLQQQKLLCTNMKAIAEIESDVDFMLCFYSQQQQQ